MQLRTAVGAHSSGEHVGAVVIAGDLTVGEFSPVSVRVAVVKREVRDDRWDPSVSDSAFKMIFSFFKME